MSAWEQKKEPQDKRYQYLLFAAEPYEVIAFKARQPGTRNPKRPKATLRRALNPAS